MKLFLSFFNVRRFQSGLNLLNFSNFAPTDKLKHHLFFTHHRTKTQIKKKLQPHLLVYNLFLSQTTFFFFFFKSVVSFVGLVHKHTHTHTKLSLPGPGLLWRLAVLFCRWPWCWSLGACWWPCFCACWCAWEHWQMPILPNQRTRVKTLLPKSSPSTTPPWDTTSTWSPGRGRNAHTDQQPGPEHWKHTQGCRSLTITLGATALLVQNVSKQWYQKKKTGLLKNFLMLEFTYYWHF